MQEYYLAIIKSIFLECGGSFWNNYKDKKRVQKCISLYIHIFINTYININRYMILFQIHQFYTIHNAMERKKKIIILSLVHCG